MKNFILNFTKIVEKNPKVYWSIILGIVACLALFVIEAFHVQHILTILNTKDQAEMRITIEPIAQSYRWVRIAILIAAIVWSNFEYMKTKALLGLK